MIYATLVFEGNKLKLPSIHLYCSVITKQGSNCLLHLSPNDAHVRNTVLFVVQCWFFGLRIVIW